MFDLIDISIADFLGVSVETYVDTIEQATTWRAEVIIINAIQGTNQAKAKRVFLEMIKLVSNYEQLRE